MTGYWLQSTAGDPLMFLSLGATVPLGERQAVFLDRDGVLNEAIPDPDTGLPESPLAIEDVRLVPGAAQGARELADAGYLLACVSNQPGAAKGKISIQHLLQVHERVLKLLADEGVRLECSFLCPHHPEGSVPHLSFECACRKPQPGLLLKAAEMLGVDCKSSWMIGDTDADLQAGQAVGCRLVHIEYAGSRHRNRGRRHADLRAANLINGVSQMFCYSISS